MAALARLRRAKERFGGEPEVPSPPQQAATHDPLDQKFEQQYSQQLPRSPREPPISSSDNTSSDERQMLVLRIEYQRQRVHELEDDLQSRFGVAALEQPIPSGAAATTLDKTLAEKKAAQLRVLELEDEKRVWELGAKLVVQDSSAPLVSSLTVENESLSRCLSKLRGKLTGLEESEEAAVAQQEQLKESAISAEQVFASRMQL